MSDLSEGHIFNIDKPYGWGSTDVVRKLKVALRKAGYPKRFKIGHAGTLDPLATGVLLVCVGRATKQVNELQAESKTYEFTVTLGATTPSFDLEHAIDNTYPYEHITTLEIESYLTSIKGEQLQMPPLYSAKRVDGKRAYDSAREGITEVALKPASIVIYETSLITYEAPNALCCVQCSKGTYVRSIARDMGLALGSGGHLSTLKRTKSGGYNIVTSLTIEQAIEYIETHPYQGED